MVDDAGSLTPRRVIQVEGNDTSRVFTGCDRFEQVIRNMMSVQRQSWLRSVNRKSKYSADGLVLVAVDERVQQTVQ